MLGAGLPERVNAVAERKKLEAKRRRKVLAKQAVLLAEYIKEQAETRAKLEEELKWVSPEILKDTRIKVVFNPEAEKDVEERRGKGS